MFFHCTSKSFSFNERVSQALYFSISVSDTGNSTILEKLLLFKVVFHSAKVESSTFVFKTQTIIAL
jgi:hypothetical protein